MHDAENKHIMDNDITINKLFFMIIHERDLYK